MEATSVPMIRTLLLLAQGDPLIGKLFHHLASILAPCLLAPILAVTIAALSPFCNGSSGTLGAVEPLHHTPTVPRGASFSLMGLGSSILAPV